jgi:hypothetical protein
MAPIVEIVSGPIYRGRQRFFRYFGSEEVCLERLQGFGSLQFRHETIRNLFDLDLPSLRPPVDGPYAGRRMPVFLWLPRMQGRAGAPGRGLLRLLYLRRRQMLARAAGKLLLPMTGSIF